MLNNLIAHWKMNDNAATATVVDAMGGYNGTYKDKDGDLNTDTGASIGKINGALDFDGMEAYGGTAEYVDCSDPFESIFQNSFSISLWALSSRRPIGSSRWIFGASTAGEENCVWIGATTNGTVFSQYTSNDNRARFIPSNVIFPDGQATEWVHLVLVHDKTVRGLYGLQLFINAVLGTTVNDLFRGNTTNVDPSEFNWTVNPAIAAEGFPTAIAVNFWSGRIDNVMLFSKALNLKEVRRLYRGGMGTEKIPSLQNRCLRGRYSNWDRSRYR